MKTGLKLMGAPVHMSPGFLVLAVGLGLMSGVGLSVVGMLTWIAVVTASILFNLLPIPGFDGHKALTSMAESRKYLR